MVDEQKKPEEIVKPVSVVAEVPKKSTITVRAVAEREGFCICITAKGDGFLVPSGDCPELHTDFEINPGTPNIKPLYNWRDEIEHMLPTREQMILNIQKALWINGAYSPDKAKVSKVRANIMRGAFPYVIKIKEEN